MRRPSTAPCCRRWARLKHMQSDRMLHVRQFDALFETVCWLVSNADGKRVCSHQASGMQGWIAGNPHVCLPRIPAVNPTFAACLQSHKCGGVGASARGQCKSERGLGGCRLWRRS